MKVFKFGGASLRTAAGIRNVGKILGQSERPLLIVVSAMGKTTDMLERVQQAFQQTTSYKTQLYESKNYHYQIIDELFQEKAPVLLAVNLLFEQLEKDLHLKEDFDLVYDQVVSKGELISSVIVYYHLIQLQLPAYWLDARTCIETDNTFREGKVDWEKTQANILRIH